MAELGAFALRLVVGILLIVGVKGLAAVAYLVNLLRKFRGLPDADKPLPAAFRLEQRGSDAAGDDAPAAADAADTRPVRDAGTQQEQRERPQQPAKAGARGAVEAIHLDVDIGAGTGSDVWRLVGPYLRKYGSGALSSSTLWNPEFKHMVVPGVGSVPYVICKGYNRTVVVGVGDPLCHPSDWPEMVRTFMEAYPHGCFSHASLEFAKVLSETQKQLTINDLGAETTLMVQRFAYGKKTRTIRNGARDARAAGFTVREIKPSDLTYEVRRQLAEVTGDWLGQKAVGDTVLRIFIRFLDYANESLEEGVRLFVAEAPARATVSSGDSDCGSSSEGEADLTVRISSGGSVSSEAAGGRSICGFVLLDPMFRGGDVYGYVTSLNRMKGEAHPGCMKLMYDEVMNAIKKEGKEALTFGFSPMFNLQTKPFRGAWWTELTNRFFFHYGTPLYQFQNLAFSKARYGGGVDGDRYLDPNVLMTHVYNAIPATALPDLKLLDTFVFMMNTGFVGEVEETVAKLLGIAKSCKPKTGLTCEDAPGAKCEVVPAAVAAAKKLA